MVDNWTTTVEKNEDELFVLQFAYKCRIPIDTNKELDES